MLTLLLLLPGSLFAAEFAYSPSAAEKAAAADLRSIEELDKKRVYDGFRTTPESRSCCRRQRISIGGLKGQFALLIGSRHILDH